MVDRLARWGCLTMLLDPWLLIVIGTLIYIGVREAFHRRSRGRAMSRRTRFDAD